MRAVAAEPREGRGPNPVGAARAAMLGIVMIGLAGCGGGGEQPVGTAGPKTTSTTAAPTVTSTTATTTTPPTASTTASTSPMPPAAATAKGYSGAVAAATAFLTAYNTANRDADTRAFDGLYTAQCTDCEALRKAVQERADKGWHTRADVYTLDDVRVEKHSASNPDKEPITASIVVMVTTNKVPVSDRAGRFIDTFDPKKISYRLGLTYSGYWQVVRFKKVA